MLVFAQKTHIRSAKTAFFHLFPRRRQGSFEYTQGSFFRRHFCRQKRPRKRLLSRSFLLCFFYFFNSKNKGFEPSKSQRFGAFNSTDHRSKISKTVLGK